MADSKRPPATQIADTANPDKSARKAYVSPRLRAYGSVAKLTQTGTGSLGDGGTMVGMTAMTCL